MKTLQKQKKKNEVYLDSDPVWTLAKWKQFIDSLLEDYPSDSVLSTDAGYNNVSLVLEYTKCKKV